MVPPLTCFVTVAMAELWILSLFQAEAFPLAFVEEPTIRKKGELITHPTISSTQVAEIVNADADAFFKMPICWGSYNDIPRRKDNFVIGVPDELYRRSDPVRRAGNYELLHSNSSESNEISQLHSGVKQSAVDDKISIMQDENDGPCK